MPLRGVVIWAALALAIGLPIIVAALSPLLEWRDPIYIIAGFAGVVGLAVLLVQPLLAGGLLPGLSARPSRQVHRWLGAGLIVAVVIHVAALWITSPPDVVDALLFRSPTPFSAWGVIAMVAVFASGLMVALRGRFRLALWRAGHTALAVVIVGTSIVHALLIDGTMGFVTKGMLCALAVAALAQVIADRKAWVGLRRARRDPET